MGVEPRTLDKIGLTKLVAGGVLRELRSDDPKNNDGFIDET